MNSHTAFYFAIGLTCGLLVSFMFTQYSGLTHTAKMQLTNNFHSREVLQRASGKDAAVKSDEEYDEHGHLVFKAVEPALSHDQLDLAQGHQQANKVEFRDQHFHHDDDSVAEELKKKVRVLCWVMTAPQNLELKASNVKNTWGKRCNVLLFMSSKDDKDFPAIGLDIPEGREHLTGKTMRAFKYAYDHHFNDADWFMKADDDTYVIVENLRYMLSEYNSSDPIYFGHHFQTIVKQGYFSGGAGYVISKEALKRLALNGIGRPDMCRQDGGAEDAEIGQCFEKLGVKTGDSRDAMGRSRFHCFNPETHLLGGYPDWYYKYDKYGAKHGIGNVSDHAVTFHYIPPSLMWGLEFYIYHLRPYGIESHSQRLNKKQLK
ncbi:glycoprotein-N-acetylgalactosamine 3-beta-galactosyltransferase 1-like [Lingula anatina]|uniref:Glycoprotein-N-acetylgalactosamine 3-beta-galactosyltransferase 1 n=1 Tax=Lingula anatina TaxID=7574 RepID=A0A1S3K9Z6_LINAN|nr:glycoprotein-N-acetylgalactosamine 3-beta-galactosyltransferase 1-like [Lingula anatina]|eukprot:XP_013419453.1 glycoprotein-N-acetylgalactosamine 3-beta-galactosyltransferase 1-like [Lingula anatina]